MKSALGLILSRVPAGFTAFLTTKKSREPLARPPALSIESGCLVRRGEGRTGCADTERPVNDAVDDEVLIERVVHSLDRDVEIAVGVLNQAGGRPRAADRTDLERAVDPIGVDVEEIPVQRVRRSLRGDVLTAAQRGRRGVRGAGTTDLCQVDREEVGGLVEGVAGPLEDGTLVAAPRAVPSRVVIGDVESRGPRPGIARRAAAVIDIVILEVVVAALDSRVDVGAALRHRRSGERGVRAADAEWAVELAGRVPVHIQRVAGALGADLEVSIGILHHAGRPEDR